MTSSLCVMRRPQWKQQKRKPRPQCFHCSSLLLVSTERRRELILLRYCTCDKFEQRWDGYLWNIFSPESVLSVWWVCVEWEPTSSSKWASRQISSKARASMIPKAHWVLTYSVMVEQLRSLQKKKALQDYLPSVRFRQCYSVHVRFQAPNKIKIIKILYASQYRLNIAVAEIAKLVYFCFTKSTHDGMMAHSGRGMQAYPIDAATLPLLWVGGGVGWCLTFV